MGILIATANATSETLKECNKCNKRDSNLSLSFRCLLTSRLVVRSGSTKLYPGH